MPIEFVVTSLDIPVSVEMVRLDLLGCARTTGLKNFMCVRSSKIV